MRSFFLTLLAGAFVMASPQAPEPGLVRGRIVLGDTGDPVAEAQIRIVGRNGREYGATETSADGAFAVVVPPGLYRLVVDRCCDPRHYLLGAAGAEGTNEEGDVFRVRSGRETVIRHAVPLAGAIGGQVLSRPGEPVRYAVARVSASATDNDGRSIRTQGSAITDSDGRFLVSGLAPGAYRVRVEPPERNEPDQQGAVLLPTYHQGTVDPALAAPVAIASGEIFDAVSVTLVRGSLPAVAGALFDASAPLLEGRELALAQRDARAVTLSRAVADRQGRFEFHDVAPGSYELRVALPGTGAAAPMVLEVGAAGVHDIIFDVTPPRRVMGRAVYARDDHPNAAALTVVAIAERENTDIVTTAVDGRGRFEFETSVPRTIGVTGVPAGWWVTSVAAGRDDITNVPATPAALATSPVVVTLDRETASVDGEVGPSDEAAVVVLISEDRRTWSNVNSSSLRFVEPNDDGRFGLEGVLPGSYRVAVLPHLPAGFTARDADVIARIAQQGITLEIRERRRYTVDLRRPDRRPY